MESFQNNYRRINSTEPFVKQDSAGTVIRGKNRKTNPHYFLFAEFECSSEFHSFFLPILSLNVRIGQRHDGTFKSHLISFSYLHFFMLWQRERGITTQWCSQRRKQLPGDSQPGHPRGWAAGFSSILWHAPSPGTSTKPGPSSFMERTAQRVNFLLASFFFSFPRYLTSTSSLTRSVPRWCLAFKHQGSSGGTTECSPRVLSSPKGEC